MTTSDPGINHIRQRYGLRSMIPSSRTRYRCGTIPRTSMEHILWLARENREPAKEGRLPKNQREYTVRPPRTDQTRLRIDGSENGKTIYIRRDKTPGRHSSSDIPTCPPDKGRKWLDGRMSILSGQNDDVPRLHRQPELAVRRPVR